MFLLGGTPNPPTNPPTDPYRDVEFTVDVCELVLDDMNMEFDEDPTDDHEHDPQQGMPKPHVDFRFVTEKGTIFTEWTDNSGRKHVHIQLTSYYQGFITSFRAGLLTVGANVSTIFEMFKDGKFVWPVSWAGLYSAQADYIFLEMGEYYKHKKERNNNNGGNCK